MSTGSAFPVTRFAAFGNDVLDEGSSGDLCGSHTSPSAVGVLFCFALAAVCRFCATLTLTAPSDDDSLTSSEADRGGNRSEPVLCGEDLWEEPRESVDWADGDSPIQKVE